MHIRKYFYKKYCDVGMIQHWLQKNRKLERVEVVITGYKRRETGGDKLNSQQQSLHQ